MFFMCSVLGTQVLYVLPIDQDLEIAKVGNRGLALSCDADSFVVKFPKQESWYIVHIAFCV